MKFKLGLTGSMGMGKTSTASLFEKYNCGVWNADKAVHRLYGRGGEAVKPIAKFFPKAIKEGSVNRIELKKYLSEDFDQITLLENIVHPLVSAIGKNLLKKQNIRSMFSTYHYCLRQVLIKPWIK